MKLKLKHKLYTTVLHGFIGSLVGILVLHPVNGMVLWFEHGGRADDFRGLWFFVLESLGMVFSAGMLPMISIFAVTGAAIGVGFGLFGLRSLSRNGPTDFVSDTLAVDLPGIIALGEGECIEFKSSLRWDFEKNCTNRALEGVVAKTIAGFMNHRGGNLLIGVADSGEILGLNGDYKTLKHKNRDGFERSLVDLVRTRLGGDKCALVHCVFYEIEGKDVCRVIVEPSTEVSYCLDGKIPKYYLRAGNGTRELNVREALEHVTVRRSEVL